VQLALQAQPGPLVQLAQQVQQVRQGQLAILVQLAQPVLMDWMD
jgi:hypothetical protein